MEMLFFCIFILFYISPSFHCSLYPTLYFFTSKASLISCIQFRPLLPFTSYLSLPTNSYLTKRFLIVFFPPCILTAHVSFSPT